jgi:glycosyltransferase involved in cell wall biosynthesis
VKDQSILVMLQYGTNIGYAIAPLETTFYNMALKLGFSQDHIHFAYKNMEKGKPQSLPDSFSNVIEFNSTTTDKTEISEFCTYIKNNNIQYIFGFDLPAKRDFYKVARESGLKAIVSYYGAPMSSINTGLKLLLKKLEVKLIKNGPDHYVFESNAMRETAVNGRGIALERTSVVPLGVDIDKYTNIVSQDINIYKEFSIPENRKVVFYAGHMQRRKGVHVLVDAIAELINNRERQDTHLLILGNKQGESEWLEQRYKGTNAENYITFGGYRNDLHKIMPHCYVGAIASNGWDSFPRSAIEMQSCGLPLLVSDFQGLVETIENGKTGKLFIPGDYQDLADKIESFLKSSEERDQYSKNARSRVENGYTLEIQLDGLVKVVSHAIS